MPNDKHMQVADTEESGAPRDVLQVSASVPDTTIEQLYQTAARFGVLPEEVLRASVEYLLAQSDIILAGILKDQQAETPGAHAVNSEEGERRQQMVAQLAMRGTPRPRPARDAWRRNLNQVRSNSTLQEILAEAQRISESDRPD